MNTLDCETLKTTEESLCCLLDVSYEQLQERVEELKGMEFEVNTDLTDDRWLPMLRYAARNDFNGEREGITCWFHATRAHDAKSFLAGIGCLQNRLEPTWAFLHTLVADCISQAEWLRFRREAENDHFGHLPDVVDAWMSNHGPYAFLFAETPLNPMGTCYHDYLGVSELVEFIANYFDRKYPVSLSTRHMATTKPLLVKFVTSGIKAMHVGAALDYLVHRKANWSIDGLSPCFAGEGEAVPAERVIKLIQVEESHGLNRNHPKYRFASGA